MDVLKSRLLSQRLYNLWTLNVNCPIFRYKCECKPGYSGTGETGDCADTCEGRCRNEVGHVSSQLDI
jgi:hypothetical protein